MGYFDKAIAARDEIIELDEEEYLAHSRFGSFRKNHKYIGRIWKGGRWVYQYAKKAGKDAVGKLTGDYYESEAKKHESDAKRYMERGSKHFVNATKDAAKERTPEEDARYEEYWRKEQALMRRDMDKEIQSESAARKARRKAENAPLKKVEKAVSKVKSALTPKTTITQTSNLYPERTKKVLRDDTGSKPKGTYFTVGSDGTTVQYTPETKKKKKLFHDDLHESVALGEYILSDFFGR